MVCDVSPEFTVIAWSIGSRSSSPHLSLTVFAGLASLLLLVVGGVDPSAAKNLPNGRNPAKEKNVEHVMNPNVLD